MLDKMSRVFLFRGSHPMYETLVRCPPEGIEYFPKKKSSERDQYTLYNPGQSAVRRIVDGAFEVLRAPRCVPVVRKYDLVHSSRGFLVLGRNKFVVDIEHVDSFAGMRHERMSSPQLRRLIEKGLISNRCAAILPHCTAARRTISLVTSDSRILEKATVIYPSVFPAPARLARPDDSSPSVLFMGEYYWKGGREVIQVCERLAKRLDFRLVYISLRVHPPTDVITKAKESFNFEYHEGPVSRAELFSRVYPLTDIFVMPTYFDSFGYAFLEAMSYGIPCVGTDIFAVPEIIENEVTGLLVKPHLSYYDDRGIAHPELPVESADSSSTVEGLCKTLDRLLSSKSLRIRMGSESIRSVEEGKFSIRARNIALKEVYGRCMSS